MTGPQPALAELFQSHRQGLAGAVRGVLGGSADVAEVLQDAFLKCWDASRRGEVPRDPVAWIFVVTWNVAVDARRRAQRRPPPTTLDEEAQMKLATEVAPSAALEQREQLAAAEAAIARLEDREKHARDPGRHGKDAHARRPAHAAQVARSLGPGTELTRWTPTSHAPQLSARCASRTP